jgi:ABC-type cobalt transport system substrate-binding protein
MSQHQSHESDRSAAYRGLLIGAIVIGILLVTIVKLTNASYAGAEGKKTGSVSAPHASTGPLDA